MRLGKTQKRQIALAMALAGKLRKELEAGGAYDNAVVAIVLAELVTDWLLTFDRTERREMLDELAATAAINAEAGT
jgi:hypothetical protein